MKLRLLIIMVSVLAVHTIAAQIDESIGESSDVSSASPIQSENFTLADPQNYRDDTLGDQKINDNDKPGSFVNVTGHLMSERIGVVYYTRDQDELSGLSSTDVLRLS